ncbi:MAG: hypothetical protein ACD_61C00208G0001 [uncultured bacterium]|nr:MAG: hypothetical protein ACD_61C00208G0001 [uncultured bacterium]
MRVNKGDSLAVLNIVDRHPADQSGFTGTGFSEDVSVTEAIYPLLHTEDRHVILVLGLGKKVVEMSFTFRNIFIDRKVRGCLSFECFAPGDPFDRGEQDPRKVEDGGYFAIV